MNVWILGYLAVLWGLHREKRCSLIADGLAANWAVNQLIVMANGGAAPAVPYPAEITSTTIKTSISASANWTAGVNVDLAWAVGLSEV